MKYVIYFQVESNGKVYERKSEVITALDQDCAVALFRVNNPTVQISKIETL